MFGRVLDERPRQGCTSGSSFIGFNLTFFPQHMLGMLGMPRRVYTYHEHGLWEAYNLVSTIGSYVMGVGMLVFVVQRDQDVARRRARRQRPVARRHARVVHDLAAAGLELRQGPVRDERAAAARPAPPARRRRGASDGALGTPDGARSRSPAPGSRSSRAPPAGARRTACSRRSRCRRSRRSSSIGVDLARGGCCRPRSRRSCLFGLAALLTEPRRPPRVRVARASPRPSSLAARRLPRRARRTGRCATT